MIEAFGSGGRQKRGSTGIYDDHIRVERLKTGNGEDVGADLKSAITRREELAEHSCGIVLEWWQGNFPNENRFRQASILQPDTQFQIEMSAGGGAGKSGVKVKGGASAGWQPIFCGDIAAFLKSGYVGLAEESVAAHGDDCGDGALSFFKPHPSS